MGGGALSEHECNAQEGQKRALVSLELELWEAVRHLLWMLGTEFRFSARARLASKE